jgi:hypothetical protein
MRNVDVEFFSAKLVDVEIGSKLRGTARREHLPAVDSAIAPPAPESGEQRRGILSEIPFCLGVLMV